MGMQKVMERYDEAVYEAQFTEGDKYGRLALINDYLHGAGWRLRFYLTVRKIERENHFDIENAFRKQRVNRNSEQPPF